MLVHSAGHWISIHTSFQLLHIYMYIIHTAWVRIYLYQISCLSCLRGPIIHSGHHSEYQCVYILLSIAQYAYNFIRMLSYANIFALHWIVLCKKSLQQKEDAQLYATICYFIRGVGFDESSRHIRWKSTIVLPFWHWYMSLYINVYFNNLTGIIK